MRRNGDVTIVALGGNALLRQGDTGTVVEQQRRAGEAAAAMVGLARAGGAIVVTHGNGPIVGNIFSRHERCAPDIPPMPLDVCGAESQGNIGYLIGQALANALRPAGIACAVASVLTRVVVDPNDPAFHHPTKPVGRFYSAEEARRCPFPVLADGRRGYRRVVASPRPQHIVELEAIRALVTAGVLVIAVGGGGVPVVRGHDGTLCGVEAVIDKDLASSLLARELRADTFVILTDIDRVYLDFLTTARRPVSKMGADEAAAHLAAGEFLPGSMGPKVEAVLEFLRAGGRRVIICLPEEASAAMAGEAGTTILP